MLCLDLPFLLASNLIRLYYAILTNLWSSIVKPISNMHNSIFNIFHSLFNFFRFHDQCTEQSINPLSSNMGMIKECTTRGSLQDEMRKLYFLDHFYYTYSYHFLKECFVFFHLAINWWWQTGRLLSKKIVISFIYCAFRAAHLDFLTLKLYENFCPAIMGHCDMKATPSLNGVPFWWRPCQWIVTDSTSRWLVTWTTTYERKHFYYLS